MATYKIGFIGAGQMGKALARGIVKSGICVGANVHLFSPVEAEMQEIEAEGFSRATGNIELINTCDFIIIAVKPQVLHRVFSELTEKLCVKRAAQVVFISILPGVSHEMFFNSLPAGRDSKVVRVMPNTPCMVGMGLSGVCPNNKVPKQEADFVLEIFRSVGVALLVEEGQMDGITGVAGSGVAFVYTIIEALSDAGVKHGLPRPIATQAATQTLLGGVSLVKQTGSHPAVLREQVTSPGGTTIAGIAAIEEHGLRNALIKGVDAIVDRSRCLAAEADAKSALNSAKL
eukprot:Selendium_serpulae@DN5071_c0_g1_i2.p1